jgi:hypothetical protein
MEFEPRNRLATIAKPILIGVGILLLVASQIWRSHYASSFGFGSPFGMKKVSLPTPIHTLAEGYSLAVKLTGGSTNTALVSASVTLKHEPEGFEPEMVNYTFLSPTTSGKGRMAMVMIMNSRREAYLTANNRMDFDRAALPWKEPLPVPPPIDVPQVIEIANTNGLKRFFSRAGKESMVAMTLMNSTNGPVWQIIGMSMTAPSAGVQFQLTVDGRTGAVLEGSPVHNPVR